MRGENWEIHVHGTWVDSCWKKHLAWCGVVVGCRKVHVSCFGNWSRLLSLSQPLLLISGNSGNSKELMWLSLMWPKSLQHRTTSQKKEWWWWWWWWCVCIKWLQPWSRFVRLYLVTFIFGISLILTSAAEWIVCCSPLGTRDQQIIRCGLELGEAERERADRAVCADPIWEINHLMTSPLFFPLFQPLLCLLGSSAINACCPLMTVSYSYRKWELDSPCTCVCGKAERLVTACHLYGH